MERDRIDWKKCVSRGKYLLSARKPGDAFACFEEAIHDCPNDDPEALADILYHCGLSLEELGVTDEAVRCWEFSLRHGGEPETGPAAEKVRAYGSRSATKGETDYALFSAVQRAKYFHEVETGAYRNDAEFYRIEAIIAAYWRELKDSGILDIMQQNDKIALFYEIQIDFFVNRSLSLPESGKNGKIMPFRGENGRF